VVEADFDAAAGGPSSRPEFAVVFTGAHNGAKVNESIETYDAGSSRHARRLKGTKGGENNVILLLLLAFLTIVFVGLGFTIKCCLPSPRTVRLRAQRDLEIEDLRRSDAVKTTLTEIVAVAAGDPSCAGRTWVLITESPDGGWGLAGHANTNTDIAAAA
jgi:hypothetical protein